MTSAPFSEITIVGLGLLGSSLAEVIRKRFPVTRILGVSSPTTLAKALDAKIIDAGFSYADLHQAIEKTDLIILCTPIAHIQEILKGWISNTPALRLGCIVTDVGSTKSEICALAQNVFAKTPEVYFIGSHPMAGSEKTGIEARDAHLFENASWVLCPPENVAEDIVAKLQAFVEVLGARTTRMQAAEHDRIAAHVSHLPQIISTALASFIGEQDSVVENCLQIAGGGFRDMTRIAASSYAMWEPIIKTNRNEVLSVLNKYREHLAKLEAAVKEIDQSNQSDFKTYFQEGNALRSRLTVQKKGFSAALTEILVDLQDAPGTLLRVLQPLAEKGLNVLDVEILKVREGEEGTLMLAFKKQHEAHMAIDYLMQKGFSARLR